MSDIMARMRDQQQLHLQNAERDFCATLNALAGRLLGRAARAEAKASGGRAEAKASGEGDLGEEEGGGQGSASKGRKRAHSKASGKRCGAAGGGGAVPLPSGQATPTALPSDGEELKSSIQDDDPVGHLACSHC